MRSRAAGRSGPLFALALLLVILLTQGSARAHTGLVSSAPFDGERLDAAPSHVVLEFAAPVSTTGSSVRVLDGQGAERADGVLLSHTGRGASVVLAPGGATGRWQVRYEVRGEDGHLVAGAFGFGVDAPAAPRRAALPVLPAAGTAAAVLGVALVVLRGWARRDPGPSP